MAQDRPGRGASFVVRFYGVAFIDRREWRGQVEYVQTGEKRPFHGAEALLRVLEAFGGQRQSKANKPANNKSAHNHKPKEE